MARTSKVWFRKANSTYYTTINGQQIPLSTNKREAHEKFKELTKGNIQKIKQDTVVAILDQFLAWNDANRKPRTQEIYLRFLQPFAKSIGTLRVQEIKTHHVQQFIDTLNGGDTVKNMGWRALNRAFNWAIRQELLDRNPVTNAEKPASKVREDYVTEAEYKIVLDNTKDQEFRDLLTIAWQCGARPQELFTVESHNVELEKSRWHFQHGKKGIRRFVYLTEEAEAITRRLMEKYPTGQLLRNTRGQPWDRHAVKCRFERLKGKVGRQLSLYLFRHSQITRQLAEGMDSHFVAALSGHRDSRMIDQVYGHAKDDWKLMRDKLRGTST